MTDSISNAHDAGYRRISDVEDKAIRVKIARDYIGKWVVNLNEEIGKVTTVDIDQYMFLWTGIDLNGKSWEGRTLRSIDSKYYELFDKVSLVEKMVENSPDLQKFVNDLNK